MTDPQMPTSDHVHFDDLCQDVEEYENLAELHPRPTGPPAPGEADADVIDAAILGGLVSP